ncbi:hypothetical protein MVEG_05211 [Podila verticillata NRRL 6337]|nr:hypothetical protein MVEG_05211 [Podila verticillata NRRL 6337]
MPFKQPDPWSNQFFKNIKVRDDVVIPVKDFNVWPLYPDHRWIYDKLAVALSQELKAAPHGVPSPSYPVFSEHVSSDAAVMDGVVVWWSHTTGISAGEGSFNYWHIHAKAMPEIENYCSAWSDKHLAGYTGMANFETIGGRIIEAHLRLTNQWPDLYGKGWLDAIVRLYTEKRWVFEAGFRARDMLSEAFGLDKEQ